MRTRPILWTIMALAGFLPRASGETADGPLGVVMVSGNVSPESLHLGKTKLTGTSLSLEHIALSVELPSGAPRLLRQDSEVRCFGLSVTPDGSRAVFNNGLFQHRELVVVDKSAREIVKLDLKGREIDGAPVLLLDGKHIGFSDGKVIETMGLDGKDVKRIIPGVLPHWSPDGRTILYTNVLREVTRDDRAILRLSACNADGTGDHFVAPEGSCNGWFSPDGKRIAYIQVGVNKTDVCVADADGSNARTITPVPGYYASPRWVGSGRISVVAGREIAEAASKAGVTRKDAAAKKAGTAPVGNKPEPKTRKEQRAAERLRGKPSTIYLISTAGIFLRQLSPKPEDPEDVPRYSVDSSAIELIEYANIDPPTRPSREVVEETAPKLIDLPAGTTVKYSGTKVFLVEASGKIKPMPDGFYRLPGGLMIYVVAGNKTMPDFDIRSSVIKSRKP